MGAGPWTESEDQILRREYARQCIGRDYLRNYAAASNAPDPLAENTSSTIRWDTIAHYLPGRTSRDVRKRWVNVLQNQFNKGAWTKGEDDRLRIAVQLYGTRWVTVAKDVGTRSADREYLASVHGSTELIVSLECSKRWNQHLDPALVHSQWTEDKVRPLPPKRCDASSDSIYRSDSSSEQSRFTGPTGVLSSKCIFRAVHQIASRTSKLSSLYYYFGYSFSIQACNRQPQL